MPIAIQLQDDEHDMIKVTPPGSSPDLVKVEAEHSENQHQHMIKKEPDLDEDQKQNVDDDVQKKMDEAVRKLKEQSQRLQAAASPYAHKTRDFAEQKPVLFTFLAIFIALSIIPVACFIGFLLTATITILGIAAVGICLSTLTAILIGASILLPILLFTLVLSTMTLVFLLSLFLIHRLYLHLVASTRENGETVADYTNLSAGVSSWMEETKGRIGLGEFGGLKWINEKAGHGGKWVLGGDSDREKDWKMDDNGGMDSTEATPVPSRLLPSRQVI